MKHVTPGPWEVLENPKGGFPRVLIGPEISSRFSESYRASIIINEGPSPDQVERGISARGTTMETVLANAHLIAEAGMVHHETGMTPRELSEQRDSTTREFQKIWDYSVAVNAQRDELLKALERMLMHSKVCVQQLYPDQPLIDFNWITQAEDVVASVKVAKGQHDSD